MTFTLLPAVDVASGRAVRLVQGEEGTETTDGDPRDAALAWQREGAESDPPRRPRRRVRAAAPTLSCWPPWSASWTSGSSCRAASATTPRSSVRSPPAARGQPGHGRAGGPRLVRPRDRSSRRTGGRRARREDSPRHRRRAPAPAGRPRRDHRRRRPVGHPRPARPRRLRPLRRHRRGQGRDVGWPERGADARRRQGHARPGHRVRRHRADRRPGHAGARRGRRREHRGLDRRHGALRGPVHPLRGAGRGARRGRRPPRAARVVDLGGTASAGSASRAR